MNTDEMQSMDEEERFPSSLNLFPLQELLSWPWLDIRFRV
jgi:hypothetical protein